MKRIALLIGVSLVAGVVGYFLGMFALLTATGLDEATWLPVAALVGIGLASGIGVGLTARIPSRAALGLASAGAATGGLLGFGIKETVDSFEWAIVVGTILAIGVAVAARTLATNRSSATH